jgi:hypothetical protein
MRVKTREEKWREAYSLAYKLVGAKGIETSLLAVGMIFHESLENNEIKVTVEPKRSKKLSGFSGFQTSEG